MAAAYSHNSMNRQGRGGRPGQQLQSQMSSQSRGSQDNLAGTLNRTHVERRPAQFISARGRIESDSLLDDNEGRRSPKTSTLQRTAKSQDRLNSAGLGGSRGNLSQQPMAKSRSQFDVGAGSRNNGPSAPPQQQPIGSPNYSNVSNYNNKHLENDNNQNRISRETLSSTSSIHSNVSVSSISNSRSSTAIADGHFHEFEKVRRDYLRRGKLYEDTVFLPADASVYFSRLPTFKIEWIRAREIAHMYRQPPMFFSNPIDRFDVRQGILGDCWLLAAMACLTNPDHRILFEKVAPAGQSFQDGWYAGVFRFNFWHFGEWKQVLVDDFLPTDRGNLIFVHSSQENEFWPALMEKAYAKMYGSYEALKGGHMMDALTDLTGGLTESYTFRGPHANLPENIVNILFKALERFALIGCAIDGGEERVLQNGLVAGHAYSVTDLRRILAGQHPVTLIRVRNPHGDGKEWRGRWSERSPEWQQISPNDRTKLGLVRRDDGEFWMDFNDFTENFDSLDICNLAPDAPLDVPRRWQTVEHNGRWIKGFNAGGRPSREASHWANPQYFMRLHDGDEDDDNVCSVIIQLMQKDRRKMKQKGAKLLLIGFSVYQYEKGYSVPLKKDFFEYHRAVDHSGAFVNVRQVTKRLTLTPGEYVVVPSTYDADEEADYYIRFFFEKGNVIEYCDDRPEKTETPQPPVTAEVREQEEAFKNFFYKVSGEDMDVNSFELRDAINEGLKKEPLHRDISAEACRTFVNLMDVDGSGRLGFYEFQFLWHHLRNWKKLFYQFDTDNSGKMNARELRAAVNGAGYKVSNKTLTTLVLSYADERGEVSLDNFLMLMAKVMKAFNTFHDLQKDGTTTLNLAQWLDKTLSF